MQYALVFLVHEEIRGYLERIIILKAKKTTENYLKIIYVLGQSRQVRACMIADQLGVSRPTVSVSLKRLSREGYVNVDSHNVITLTPLGEKTAKPVFERYQILNRFLVRLGVRESAALHDACEMEHGLGEESFQALKNLALRLEKEKEI